MSLNSDYPKIRLLEFKILESRTNYNNLPTLIQILRTPSTEDGEWRAATISLCRIFSLLMVSGKMSTSKGLSDHELAISQWLKGKYYEYCAMMLSMLEKSDYARQIICVKLLMQLVKNNSHNTHYNGRDGLSTSLFSDVVQILLQLENAETIKLQFLKEYVEKFADVKELTLSSMKEILSAQKSRKCPDHYFSSILTFLSSIHRKSALGEEAHPVFLNMSKRPFILASANTSRLKSQETWLALFMLDLSLQQRKSLLRLVSHQIAPHFTNIELLMDFLTDSFNFGGSVSLLSLSGLFSLMQERNLDYPLFYARLYSLLDSTLLYSKLRSRFFRLLETFLGSSHLPAALVASFIKKLSRLALFGPPSSIIVVIPFIYNLFQKHPSCTFMLHRELRVHGKENQIDLEYNDDPFEAFESDPMITNAIKSSLWEIHSLQSHYHPNIAMFSKIMSEQFTKQSYNLEDFLDHSHGSILDLEINKPVKVFPMLEEGISNNVFKKLIPMIDFGE
ncbi:MAG: hypothetical protein M1829_002434 [Trizodia sp. TS-e1964]|nr:MAG: hypothetical protein M1829_002434 [Trizodia sp. TS-e1964]